MTKRPVKVQPQPLPLTTDLLFAGAVITIVFLALKNTFPFPYTDNEGAFVLMGREMGRGAQLYADLWDHKPPFFFGQSWLLQLFLPLTEVNLHIYGFIIHTFDAFLISLLAKRLGVSKEGAWVAGLSYGALLFAPLFEPWSVTSDLLFQPFLLLSLWTALSPQASMVLLSGALWACAFLTKQSALFLFPLYLVAGLWFDIPKIFRWGLGAALVIGPTCLYFFLTGRWLDFNEALLGFNAHYVQGGWQFFFGTPAFRNFLAQWIRMAVLAYGLPLVTVVWGLWGKALSKEDLRNCLFAGTWFFAALASACASGYFFSYYYVALLPPLALGMGWAWMRWRQNPQRGLALCFLLNLAGVLTLAVNGGHVYDKLFGYAQYPTQRYFIDKSIGLAIASHANPQDQLFAWTDDPQIYVYSGLTPSVKTPFINHLSFMPYTAAKTYQDFTQKPPRFLVLSLDPQVLAPPDWLKIQLKDHYGKVKVLGDLELYLLNSTPVLK